MFSSRTLRVKTGVIAEQRRICGEVLSDAPFHCPAPVTFNMSQLGDSHAIQILIYIGLELNNLFRSSES